MKVRYVGPSGTGVDVVLPNPTAPDGNTKTVCPPGVAVDLPDQIAASLVEAGVFETVDTRRRGRRGEEG